MWKFLIILNVYTELEITLMLINKPYDVSMYKLQGRKHLSAIKKLLQ
jgi:hypothetical protein